MKDLLGHRATEKQIQKGEFKMYENSFTDVRDKIYYRLVNTELNRVMIDACPSVELTEIGVSKIYFIYLGEDSFGIRDLFVTNQISEAFNLSVEVLDACSERNTARLFPTISEPMYDIIERMEEKGIEEAKGIKLEIPFYLLTNRNREYGGSAMFDKAFLNGFGEALNQEQLYILGISEHESLIVLGNDMNDITKLTEAFHGIQAAMEDEKLTDKIIVYNVKARMYSVVA